MEMAPSIQPLTVALPLIKVHTTFTELKIAYTIKG
jgi:hypothetical protein